MNGEDGIINFNHIDAKKLDKFDISKIVHVNTLVLDNRYLKTIGLDYEWVSFEENGKPFIFNVVVESVYRGYRNDFKELNDCVPLMKWYEVLKTIPNISTRREWDRKYTSAIKTLGRLEGAGVKVVEEKFIDSFNFNPQYIKRNGIVFTQYNPYTTTGRPSNRHLNVNYSALNKSDGTRECFISRHPHGTLLQFDYESYHIRLIAKMVGYEFPKGETAHQHLANLYGCDYETAKKITFTYLYGGLDDNARGIEFFQKVDEYIKGLYQRFVISGKLTTLLYKREIPFSRIEGGNEQKVFNYLLQSLETEINYMKIGEVLDYLEGRMSKMILYTYDAFIIDTHPIERENILNDIKEIMEKGDFPVRIEEGKNYNNLEVIS
jgi:DNA polymerase I-like protein with 3'-5' exonuclease and polymerase domains